MKKKSVKPAVFRRSRTTSFWACLPSAAAIARSTCAGSFVIFFFLVAVFASLFVMQPACRRNPRRVRSPPSRDHRRVKSVVLNVLLHVRRHQAGDVLAGREPVADRSR